MTKLKQKNVSMWHIRYLLLCISIFNAYKMIEKEFTGHKPKDRKNKR